MACSKVIVDKACSSTEMDSVVGLFLLRMLQDSKTEKYVKFAKVMVICQGAYSVERASCLKELEETFKYCAYRISDKSYTIHKNAACSYETTEEYYEYFRTSTIKALEDGNNLVVIDATMSNVVQNRYYMALAYKMQYVVLVVPPIVINRSEDNMWPHYSQAFSFRSQGVYIQPSNMFQHLFCGWFLHDIDSRELRNEASLYARDCFENIKEFAEIFSRNLHPRKGKPLVMEQESHMATKSVEKGSNIDLSSEEEQSLLDCFIEYYKLGELRQDLAYCVVKIMNNMKSMNEYFKNEIVQKNFGKMSKLQVVGFIISPFMVAARVKLAPYQKDLWEMEDELDETSEIQQPCPSDLLSESKAELPNVDIKLICSKSNRTLINTRKTIYEPSTFIHHMAKGRSCHILLGQAAGAKARNIDYDVAFAIRRERKAFRDKCEPELEDLETCMVKRIGKYWYIYLKEILSVDGFFATCCKPYPYENAIL